MNERRQRAARALLSGITILVALGLASACDAGASVGGMQTAVAVGQTAVGVAQTALPALQTSLPGMQATTQAAATLVSAVMSDPQAINAQLQVVLAGATIHLEPTPADVANDAVTRLAITGTDTRNRLAQMDSAARQATAGAALRLVAQYYPNAAISLTLVDSQGQPLLRGTIEPGEGPAFQ